MRREHDDGREARRPQHHQVDRPFQGWLLSDREGDCAREAPHATDKPRQCNTGQDPYGRERRNGKRAVSVDRADTEGQGARGWQPVATGAHSAQPGTPPKNPASGAQSVNEKPRP